MKSIKNIGILSIVIAFVHIFSIPAGGIPTLEDDKSIKHGVLSNGLTWYVVNNPSSKGVVDFALVQKAGRELDDSTSSTVRIAREALTSLMRFRKCTPEEFLISNGVLPGPFGYVKVDQVSTTFYFSEVPVGNNRALADSLVLMLMDIADRANHTDDPFLKRWYSPSDQAIIVAGDINADVVSEKIRNMSLMMPSSPSSTRRGYEWQEGDGPQFKCTQGGIEGLSTLKVSWRSPRTPTDFINTAQPAVYEMFVNELGEVLCRRLAQNLRQASIPSTTPVFKFKSSEEGPSDEVFELRVTVEDSLRYKALSVMSAVVSSVREEGAMVDEFILAKGHYMENLSGSINSVAQANRSLVWRCVRSFLYSSSLMLPKSRAEFLLARNIPDTTELHLFNGVASALLNNEENMTVECSSCLRSEDSLVEAAFRVQKGGTVLPLPSLDSLLNFPFAPLKTKIKNTKNDGTNKCTIWTFQNGMTVAYRKAPTSNRIHYSLALNGGYGSIRNLSKGEGAYMSDYLFQCKIAGVRGELFFETLRRNGIIMEPHIGLSSMTISGSAPSKSLLTLMKSLYAVASYIESADSSFSYYVESEEVARRAEKFSRASRLSVLDSLLCPDYVYSSFKSAGVLTEDFPSKADAYFRRQFRRMNDGMLVIETDIDESILKKTLIEYIGTFPTSERVVNRGIVRYQPVSGWSTYTVEGQEDCIDVVMSSALPLTADNYYASAVASMVLKKRLAEAVSGNHLFISLVPRFSIYPQERLSMMISITRASSEGFALNPDSLNQLEVLSKVRSCLQNLTDIEVDTEELQVYKQYVKGELSYETEKPGYWIDSIIRRYLDGKDLSSNAQGKVDAVTQEKLKAIFSALNSGGKIEYITTTQK